AIGARSNDLPAVLMMVADHYQRANALWTRLKGLLMYPVIVLALSLLITVLLSVVFHHVYVMFQQQFNHLPEMFLLTLWIPPIAVAVIAIIFVAMISVRRFRANLRWRLPAFREASLAQLASALALMIEHGTPVTEALSL